MIKTLTIQNYALLKDVRIAFKQGFTVLGGETGAGKSIILDALSLLLGKRVERLAFSENKKSIIEGVFLLDRSKSHFFEENDIDFEELTVIRREINTNGKSRAFINDTPVLLNLLVDFGIQIVEIHNHLKTIILNYNYHKEIFHSQKKK